MNSRILLAGLTIAVLSSCSTAYKAQTPDDVYYSPERPQDEYVKVETKKDREAYRYEDEYVDDRYLRWKVRNRSRWSSFDEYYANDWYDYRYGNWSYNSYYWNRNNYWNNYWYWNNSYNPYCRNVVIVNPKNPVAYNQVRNYQPGSYKGSYNNANNAIRPKAGTGVYRPTGSYNNSNSNTLGSSIKKVFNGSSGSYNNNNSSNNSSSSGDSRPSRTYTPSSSSSSSSSGSSGGSSGSSGGGVTRPSRGGQ